MKPFEQNEDPRLQEWYADYMNVAATGGESFAMQYRRVGQFLDELRKKPYTRVAIFAHGGVLICAQLYAGILKAEEAFDALTPTAASSASISTRNSERIVGPSSASVCTL